MVRGYGSNHIYGLDPATGATKFSDHLGAFSHFTTPSAAGGKLFVADGSQSMNVPDRVTALHNRNTGDIVSDIDDDRVVGDAIAAGAHGDVRGRRQPGARRWDRRIRGRRRRSLGVEPTVPIQPADGATCTASFAHAGVHAITAAYSGDVSDAASRSASLAVTVRRGPSPIISARRLSGRGRTRTLS